MSAPGHPPLQASRPRRSSCRRRRRGSARGERILKIGLVSDWFLPRVGGIEFHLRDLALQLGKKGHQVEVVSPIRGPSLQDGVRVHRLAVPLLPPFDLICSPGAERSLEEALLQGGYDIVHCHFSFISPLAALGLVVASRHGLPVVVTFHSFLGGMARVLAALDHLVHWTRWPVVLSAVSPEIARDVRRIAPGLAVEILPNAVDPGDWDSPVPRAEPGRLRVVSTMRLERKKRPSALLDIVFRVQRELPGSHSLEVKIVGPGSERDRLEKKIRRLGLQDSVELLGYQDRASIRRLYRDMDVFVLPSILESFGIAALEARCAGLPVIAMKHGGIKSFVEHGVHGFLAEDDEQFAAYLLALARDPELRGRLGHLSRTDPPVLTWSRVVDRHLQVYQDAIELCEARTGARRRASLPA